MPGPYEGTPVRLVDVDGAPLTTDAGKLSVAVEGLTFEGDVSFDDTGIIAAVDAGTTATGAVETAVAAVETAVDEAKADIVTALQDVELSVDENKAEVIRVGTRAYGTTVRQAVGSTSAQSSAITGTEVMVHATTACYIKNGSNPTAVNNGDSIPMVAGEKLWLRITTGDKIAVIRDSADGYIFISPVA
jgi:hypothetical protein